MPCVNLFGSKKEFNTKIGLTLFPPAFRLYKQASVMRVFGENKVGVYDSKNESKICLEFFKISVKVIGTMDWNRFRIRTDPCIDKQLS
ncbi:hypothetical protein LPTSP2_26450 [Leptospira ellinghausenii]|uniref:Uncharacterized protein n=1 Tax=Leptospira ellinghausenii TaxID=1917822 RepID=A0A2P2DFF6_9LEPT|nr:hypothetical protein LPTSP2_26450 [Leptospira ellinghausenii]